MYVSGSKVRILIRLNNFEHLPCTSIFMKCQCLMFLASNGKFWSVADNDLVMLDGDGPTPFIVEFMGNSKMTIKAPNGNLLKTEQNGLFKATGTEVNANTLLEF